MKPFLTLTLWKVLLIMIPLGVTLLIAAFTDFKSRKVYNKLTYPMFLVGLIAHTIVLGLQGLGDGLLAALLVFVLGLVTMPLGWIKAGDIKLLMVIAAFIGMRGVGEVFFYSAFAGAGLGLLMSLASGRLLKVFRRIWQVIRNFFLRVLYSSKNFSLKLDESENTYMPFAIAILVGATLVLTEHLYGFPGWMSYYFDKMGWTTSAPLLRS